MAAAIHLFRRYASSLPNILILAVLIGIAAWGHATHWKIPKFSELMGAPTPRSAAPADPASPGAGAANPGSPEVIEHEGSAGPPGGADGEGLPAIRYPSREMANKAGIAIGAVQERRMDEFVTAYATIGYDEGHLAQLSCRVSGIIWQVLKKPGDHVRKGDILAILDAAEVGQAKAELLEADVDCDLKIENLERLKAASASFPERQIREAEADVRKASVRRFNARQALINMGLPISVKRMAEVTDDELARQIHFLGLPQEIAARLDADTASANLIPLLSPMDGIVVSREVVTGEVVEPSRAQFVVADVRHMWLNLNVPKTDAAQLDIGQDVYFSIPGSAVEISSKLAWIATEVDQKSRTVQVRADVENRLARPDGSQQESGQWLLRANMFGNGRIRVRQRPSILVVPSTAVQWDGTDHLVFVPGEDGTTFQPRRVELGITRDGYSEVRSGLTLGQPVVSAGAFVLKSEMIGIEN